MNRKGIYLVDVGVKINQLSNKIEITLSHGTKTLVLIADEYMLSLIKDTILRQ